MLQTAPPYFESASIDNIGEYFSKDELLNAPDFAGSVTGPHGRRDGAQSDQMDSKQSENNSAKETSYKNHTSARGM